jgi:hypothetical protein
MMIIYISRKMTDKKCAYPQCGVMTGSYNYCQPHYLWIKKNGLCFGCLQHKEVETVSLCQACYAAEKDHRRQQQRQAAIDAGLCVNYWKCTKPAAVPSGMCATCFKSFNRMRDLTKQTRPAKKAEDASPKVETVPTKVKTVSKPKKTPRDKSAVDQRFEQASKIWDNLPEDQ